MKKKCEYLRRQFGCGPSALEGVERLPEEHWRIFNLPVGAAPKILAFVPAQCLVLGCPVQNILARGGETILDASPAITGPSIVPGRRENKHRAYWIAAIARCSIIFCPHRNNFFHFLPKLLNNNDDLVSSFLNALLLGFQIGE